MGRRVGRHGAENGRCNGDASITRVGSPSLNARDGTSKGRGKGPRTGGLSVSMRDVAVITGVVTTLVTGVKAGLDMEPVTILGWPARTMGLSVRGRNEVSHKIVRRNGTSGLSSSIDTQCSGLRWRK